jgi:DNA-binding NarL/FixJ family response regulator
MATPATYREIAEKLFVSEETIRSHAKHILSKLQQPNRAQAVLAAVRAGLIELPE